MTNETSVSYREGIRNILYRNFDSKKETVAIVMNSPSTANLYQEDKTTIKINKIIQYNDLGAYYLINSNISNWEEDLKKISLLTTKLIVAWGAKERNKENKTPTKRNIILNYYNIDNIYEFEAQGNENMPTRLSNTTKIIKRHWSSTPEGKKKSKIRPKSSKKAKNKDDKDVIETYQTLTSFLKNKDINQFINENLTDENEINKFIEKFCFLKKERNFICHPKVKKIKDFKEFLQILNNF